MQNSPDERGRTPRLSLSRETLHDLEPSDDHAEGVRGANGLTDCTLGVATSCTWDILAKATAAPQGPVTTRVLAAGMGPGTYRITTKGSITATLTDEGELRVHSIEGFAEEPERLESLE